MDLSIAMALWETLTIKYTKALIKRIAKMDKESKSTVIMRSMFEDSTNIQDKDLVNTTLRMEIDMKDSGYTTNNMAGV